MSNLVTSGHTRVRDLREAYFPSSTSEDVGHHSDDERVNGKTWSKANGLNGTPATNGNGHVNGTGTANGVNKRRHDDLDNDLHVEEDRNTIKSAEELDAVIYDLMQNGWIMKVEETQYLGPGDLHAMAYLQALDQEGLPNPPNGNKDKERAATATLQRKREIRDGWSSVPRFATRKRTANEAAINPSAKRRKLDGKNASAGDEVVMLDENLVIRVNPEKVAVTMRTDLLVRLVEVRLGYVPAKVYEVMLRSIERNIGRCYEEWPDPPPTDPSAAMDREVDPRFLVNARDIAKQIDLSIDLFEGLDPHAIVDLTPTRSQVDKGRLTHPVNPFTMDWHDRTKIVDKHIRSLSDDPFHFVTWHSRSGFSEWHIEFEEIARAMIQQEVENTVAAGGERDQKYGVKLIRALNKKGKLDERQMSNAMMMPAGEIRSVVNALTLRGFVQTQEIPKVDRREAKHSIHLIWYDKQRAREKLLHDTYKGMVRLLQRLAYEKEKVQELLSKAERSDVVGNEEKWLSKDELDALKKWREVQGRLSLQLFRQDELVATLRDFIGPLTSV